MRLRKRPSEQEQLLLDSALFDETWYGERAGVSLDRLSAVRHYLAHGVPDGLSPHPLFDPGFVRRRFEARRVANVEGRDPLTVYLRRGLVRVPTHPLFDTAGYLKRVPEAVEHPGGPTAHYCEIGAAAGLAANDWLASDLRDWVRQRFAAWPSRAQADVGAPGHVAVSILMSCSEAPEEVLGSVPIVLDTTDDDVEVVLTDLTTGTADGVALDSLQRFPRVRIVRGATTPAGAIVILLHPMSRPRPGWLQPLLDTLASAEVAACSALLVAPSGAVESAGAAFPRTGGLPHPLLRDFPVEDAARVGDLTFAALTGGALAMRAADLAEVGGADPLLGDLAEVDLTRRLVAHRGGELRVVPASVVSHPAADSDLEARERYLERWPEGAQDDVELWAACGYRVLSHEVRRALPRVDRWLCAPEPVLMRTSVLQVRESPRPLRWAIKNAAPAGPDADQWGDTHFARDIAAALRDLGQEVVIDHRGAFERPTSRHDDVALLLRGPRPLRTTPEQVTIGWIISQPAEVTAEEVARYDVVYAASHAWAARRTRDWGREVRPLLQATNPARFHPHPGAGETGPDLLFVGNSRKTYRTIVRDAVESGLDLTVVGADWEPFLPEGHLAGLYHDNAELSGAYASAGIVLNDHWDDMRDEGFISNRVFDAVASGARVVSDAAVGLDELFGRSVQIYRSREDLVRLCTAPDRDALFGDAEERRKVAEQVAATHSFAARAAELLEAAVEARRRRGFVD